MTPDGVTPDGVTPEGVLTDNHRPFAGFASTPPGGCAGPADTAGHSSDSNFESDENVDSDKNVDGLVKLLQVAHGFPSFLPPLGLAPGQTARDSAEVELYGSAPASPARTRAH